MKRFIKYWFGPINTADVISFIVLICLLITIKYLYDMFKF